MDIKLKQEHRHAFTL